MTETIERRPPPPGEWFRVHPYAQKEVMLLTGDNGTEYVIADNWVKHFRKDFPERSKLMRPTMAFVAVNKNQENFLWLVPLPVSDRHPAWQAMEQWICLGENTNEQA